MKLSEKEKSVLSLISHDLKSPLIGILGFSELLMTNMTESGADESWIKWTKHIHSAGEQMQTLIGDILTMAKVAAGKELLEFSYVYDLEDQFRKTLETFELEAKAKNIKLSLEMDEIPLVYWDIFRLRIHVLNNIISNALKFTPSGGAVAIRVKNQGTMVAVVVQDTGPGIASESLTAIFNPYNQTMPHNERHFGGHGLGLFNAERFVKSHGGEVYAENVVGEGHGLDSSIDLDEETVTGARFVILLPFCANTKGE